MSDTLIFEHIKQDFTGDCAAGRANMMITVEKFCAPAQNKSGGSSGYLLQADTNFFYKGVPYTSIIIENVTITGIMKTNGATPLVSRSKFVELYNFALIKDEKFQEAYNNALQAPINEDIVTIIDKTGARVIKPTILQKKYAANCMTAVQDIPLDDPAFIIKVRVQPTLKYIYSCTFDIMNSDGTIEAMKPKRVMPSNALSDIKKTMKSQFDMYFAGKDVDRMMSSGEFVHDLPKQEDILDYIPAYSKIIIGKFELNSKCNIGKQNAFYNCDFIPSYLQIKPNPKYDIVATVNQMRNFKSTISKAELDHFENDPNEEENNNNL